MSERETWQRERSAGAWQRERWASDAGRPAGERACRSVRGAGMSLLEVAGLRAGYGAAEVLHGIDLTVAEGGATAVLGANGAGKTTLLRAITGGVRRSGRIAFDGTEITSRRTDQIARLGIGHVPQGRGTLNRLSRAGQPARRRAAAPGPPRGRRADVDGVPAAVPAAGRADRRLGRQRCPAASSRCWRSPAR